MLITKPDFQDTARDKDISLDPPTFDVQSQQFPTSISVIGGGKHYI
jgi:hypothetical protein